MADNGWRAIGQRTAAWFEQPSLTAGAELVRRIAAAGPLPEVDVRPSGVRVRVPAGDDTEWISALAGVPSDPAALQELRIVFDAVDVPGVREFWRNGFGYPDGQRLEDPLHRDPELLVVERQDARPLQNRFHIDVVRPAQTVEAVRAGRQPTGAWGVMLPDSEGNELDLVPGDAFAAEDWQTLFAAMTFYPTTSAEQAVQLVTAVAHLADAAGIALMLDVRADGVIIDHGKDAWEVAGEPFVELAKQVQTAARDLGLTAKPDTIRFVQIGLAAVDAPAVKAFWTRALGYVGTDDSYDPRRLNPGFIFQQMDAGETERRAQRNRIRLELDVAHDQLPARVEQALQAGGNIRDEQPGRCSIADPEGNELDLIAQKPL
ncbi:VOC family protein [Kribbella sp. NPDC058245]|uniref:VOC family protein n=1 Tax=Kribbella sp. NPDC058245 TaxID=3346399 RepID=UPI0036ED3065